MAAKSDPALILAQRIYEHAEYNESWTNAVERYARDVLMRHPRTVHRWLSGESPVPAVVATALGEPMIQPTRYLCAMCRELQVMLDAIAHTVECRTCPNRICDHVATHHSGRCRACRERQA